MSKRFAVVSVACALLSGCAQMKPEPVPPSEGHIQAAAAVAQDIPNIVEQAPYVPPPQAIPESERYTIVVSDVPVQELLFALARDAQINVDITSDVTGQVTLNAIDQTLPQILDRIARQVDIRYEFDGDTVLIATDAPYFRTYNVDYVNLSREVDSNVNVATVVATTGSGADGGGSGGGGGGGGAGAGGGGGNVSETRMTAKSYNRFWETLETNILAILEFNEDQGGGEATSPVIINAEAGLLTVKGSTPQHKMIAEYIDRVLTNATRQVLVEATIVEVTLNDQYQGGVDISLLGNDAGESTSFLNQSLLGATADGVISDPLSSVSFGYLNPALGGRTLQVAARLLREFGETKVVSSPRLMVLNNQTAVLKVVEELVYFEIEVNREQATANSPGFTTIESDVRSVPVGLVMSVTPQITDTSEVTLLVRPTVSEQIGNAVDPGPQLNAPGTDVTNLVPIIRTREMESVLRLVDGQIAVLGGLMQDNVSDGEREVPGLSRLPILGDAFFDLEETSSRKTELVIFLRPIIVEKPSLDGDLEDYRQFLGSSVEG